MSVFFGKAEARAVTSLPWGSGGQPISGAGMANQLSLVPVYAAVRTITDDISTMPLQQFRKTTGARAPMPLAKVLTYGAGQVPWLSQGLTSALLRGNAFGLKVGFDAATAGPGTIVWLHPDRVQEHPNGKDWLVDGRLVPAADLLHVPAMVLPGSRLGVSPMTAARVAVESGLETQRFTRDWFKNKALPGMIFKNSEKTLKPQAAADIKERLASTLRAGEPFVSGKDWTLDVISLPADDAGFVAASRMTATQIATIYGLRPSRIGGDDGNSMTYSTLELNSLADLTSGDRPWMTRFEAAFSSLLPQPQFVKFNPAGLLSVDEKSRLEAYKMRRDIGLNNIDELRLLEDAEPLPDGLGQDYTPLAKVGTPAPKETR